MGIFSNSNFRNFMHVVFYAASQNLSVDFFVFFAAHSNAEGGEVPQGGAGGRTGEAEALCTNGGGTGPRHRPSPSRSHLTCRHNYVLLFPIFLAYYFPLPSDCCHPPLNPPPGGNVPRGTCHPPPREAVQPKLASVFPCKIRAGKLSRGSVVRH